MARKIRDLSFTDKRSQQRNSYILRHSTKIIVVENRNFIWPKNVQNEWNEPLKTIRFYLDNISFLTFIRWKLFGLEWLNEFDGPITSYATNVNISAAWLRRFAYALFLCSICDECVILNIKILSEGSFFITHLWPFLFINFKWPLLLGPHTQRDRNIALSTELHRCYYKLYNSSPFSTNTNFTCTCLGLSLCDTLCLWCLLFSLLIFHPLQALPFAKSSPPYPAYPFSPPQNSLATTYPLPTFVISFRACKFWNKQYDVN